MQILVNVIEIDPTSKAFTRALDRYRNVCANVSDRPVVRVRPDGSYRVLSLNNPDSYYQVKRVGAGYACNCKHAQTENASGLCWHIAAAYDWDQTAIRAAKASELIDEARLAFVNTDKIQKVRDEVVVRPVLSDEALSKLKEELFG